MVKVFLSIGSNIDAPLHIRSITQQLSDRFFDVQSSRIYQSASQGFVADDFFNLVVSFSTDQSLAQLKKYLRQQEYAHGRPIEAKKCQSRTLDIDILLYGDTVGCIDGIELPRNDILQSAYVLRPLSELVGDALHPVLGVSYAHLWQDFRGDRQLTEVSI